MMIAHQTTEGSPLKLDEFASTALRTTPTVSSVTMSTMPVNRKSPLLACMPVWSGDSQIR